MRLLFLFCLCFVFTILNAQNYYCLDSIYVKGNRKTHAYVIRRECPIRTGDTIREDMIPELIKEFQHNLMRTQLFVYDSVQVKLNFDKKKINLYVEVKERWYIIPATYVTFLDRNINAWWLNRDWKRILVGCYLVIDNTTGNKDRLYIHAGYGYNQIAGVVYRFPYLNRKQTLGLRMEYTFARAGNMQFGISNNKQQTYYSPFPYLLQEQTSGFSILFRPGTLTEHKWNFYYKNLHGTDTLFFLQQDYFPEQRRTFRFFRTGYEFQFDNRDNKFNPSRGLAVNYSLDLFIPYKNKNQLFSRHQWAIQSHYPLRENKWILSMMGMVRKTLSENYPGYYFMQGLGYGNYTVRGYEYFIMDGGDLIFFRSTLRYVLIPVRYFKMVLPGFLQSFNTIPFSLELTLFADAGQSANRYGKWPDGFLDQNLLNPGYGAGIQLSSYYDFVIRLEYSFTPFLRGFYLGFGSGF